MLEINNLSRDEGRAVKILFLDFDGVFTDNSVTVDANGIESVRCSRLDGLGITRLKRAGVMVHVVSTETNPVVQKRCEKLGVGCQQGIQDKAGTVEAYLTLHNLLPKQAAFVGNDINDIGALQSVAIPIAVADRVPEIDPFVRFVTTRKGGCGAVREVCDVIFECGQENYG